MLGKNNSYFPGTIPKQVGHYLINLGAHKLSAQIKGLCNSASDEKEVSL